MSEQDRLSRSGADLLDKAELTGWPRCNLISHLTAPAQETRQSRCREHTPEMRAERSRSELGDPDDVGCMCAQPSLHQREPGCLKRRRSALFPRLRCFSELCLDLVPHADRAWRSPTTSVSVSGGRLASPVVPVQLVRERDVTIHGCHL